MIVSTFAAAKPQKNQPSYVPKETVVEPTIVFLLLVRPFKADEW